MTKNVNEPLPPLTPLCVLLVFMKTIKWKRILTHVGPNLTSSPEQLINSVCVYSAEPLLPLFHKTTILISLSLMKRIYGTWGDPMALGRTWVTSARSRWPTIYSWAAHNFCQCNSPTHMWLKWSKTPFHFFQRSTGRLGAWFQSVLQVETAIRVREHFKLEMMN